MKKLIQATRDSVYNAPIMQWDNDTYTPVSNKSIMDLIDNKIKQLNLNVENEHYRVTTSNEGLIKGVIGSYDVKTTNNEFGQRVMFRNSYDKSMSFAIVMGTVVWICTNGCISGDFQYRRIHRGVIENNTSTTMQDVIENINGGFNMLQASFEHNIAQMNQLKGFEIGPKDTYDILGKLFFEQEVISITQLSIIKKELAFSNNFRHLGSSDFTAFDLYNHITESLKTSHPTTYINDHVKTHSLFESLFNLQGIIIKGVVLYYPLYFFTSIF